MRAAVALLLLRLTSHLHTPSSVGRVIIRPVRKTIAVSSLITMSVLVVPAASGTHGNSHLSLRAQNKNTHIHISHSLEDMISDFKPRDSIIPQLRDERGRGQRVRWVCGNKKQTGRLNLEAGGRAGRPRRSEAGAQRKNKLSFPSIRFDHSGKRRAACPCKEKKVCGWVHMPTSSSSTCRARHCHDSSILCFCLYGMTLALFRCLYLHASGRSDTHTLLQMSFSQLHRMPSRSEDEDTGANGRATAWPTCRCRAHERR
jgi:hypothetical protein